MYGLNVLKYFPRVDNFNLSFHISSYLFLSSFLINFLVHQLFLNHARIQCFPGVEIVCLKNPIVFGCYQLLQLDG